jgi:hypothetical protein
MLEDGDGILEDVDEMLEDDEELVVTSQVAFQAASDAKISVSLKPVTLEPDTAVPNGLVINLRNGAPALSVPEAYASSDPGTSFISPKNSLAGGSPSSPDPAFMFASRM